MFKAYSTVIVLLLLCCLFACEQEKEVVMDNEIILYPDSMPQYIQDLLETETSLLCVDDLANFDTLQSQYGQNGNRALWWKALSGDSLEWVKIESYFSFTETHGMDKRYYLLPMIRYHRSQIEQISTADSAYRMIAELDVLLSNSFIESYEDIVGGRTNPKELYGHSYMLPYNKKDDMDWSKFLASKKKQELITKYYDKDTMYNKLVVLLAQENIAWKEEQEKAIDFSAYPKISPGDTADVIKQVIIKLKKDQLVDSTIYDLEVTDIYVKELVPIIKALQEKYNLAADGVLGYKTYKVINSSAYERIKQIRANLERSRWFQRPAYEDAPFIYVNLPEYRVSLFYEDSVKSMKICIGKNLPDNYDEMVMKYSDSGWLHKLPKDMETPQIAARVSQVVINPTWTVPKSIIKNEMYWQMRRDPTYLDSNHYVVFDGDSLLDNQSIDWSRFKPDKVPYRIVQIPGTHNALGQVKYIFWNAFDIFMHDTPMKSKFKLPQRAVSHGCVRLENPLLFGEFAMQASREFDSDDFRIMMGYEPLDEDRLEDYDPLDTLAAIQPIDTTFKIRLQKPIPLYMDYRTISFDSVGQAKFNYDIYDRNKYILRGLDYM